MRRRQLLRRAARASTLGLLPAATAALLEPGLARASSASAGAAALTPPRELSAEWPAARVQGRAQMRFLGLHVYDIRLWTVDAPVGAEDWPRRPLALEIEYARELPGRRIAERSLDEMRRAGPIAAEAAERWLQAMLQFFPDVRAGDRITGLQRPDGHVRFYVNGQLRGEKRDAEFARRFFGIWLAPVTSEPRLRAALLGLP
ncbi:MAG: chalcone isomerase family protein [Rubrivivax sp.]